MGNLANQNWALAQGSSQENQGPWNSLLAGLLGSIDSQAPYVDSNGWHAYAGDAPPKYALCMFRNDGFEKPIEWVGYPYDIHPEANIAYLKWKLTGLAKETLCP